MKINRLWTPKKSKGLEINEILDLKSEMADYWQGYVAQCQKDETYYDLEFDVFPMLRQKNYTVHHVSSARNAIDNAAAQIDTSNIAVEVPPRTKDKKDYDTATKLEKYHRGSWNCTLMEDPTLLSRTKRGGYLYGLQWWKYVFKEDAEIGEFPIKTLLRHPTTIYTDPTFVQRPSEGINYVIETYKCKVAEIASMYPDWHRGGLGLNGDVEWTEYWDAFGHAIVCGKEPILEYEEHGLGFIPYTPIDFGFGYEDCEGAPEKRFRGLLNASYGDLETESQLVTILETIARMNAFAPMDFEIFDRDADLEEVKQFINEYQTGPAVKNVIPFGVKKTQQTTATLPPGVYELHGIIQSYIRDSTVARVATGEQPTGAASGYMTAILVGTARLKFGTVKEAMERGMANANKIRSKIVEVKCPEGVTVWGKIGKDDFEVTVKPEDIDGYYVNRVRISSVTPEEEDRKMSMGLQALDRNALSLQTIQDRFLGVEDTTAEFERMMTERAIQSPQVQEMIASAIIQSQQFSKELPSSIAGPNGEMINLGNRGNLGLPMEMQQARNFAMPPNPPQAGSFEELDLINRQVTQGDIFKQPNPLSEG